MTSPTTMLDSEAHSARSLGLPQPVSRRVLVSVVVPVFRSGVLAELVAEIDAVFAGREEEHEIILVDDCTDSPLTWNAIEELTRNNPRVRAVQLMRNFGQHAATLCGLKESRGDFVITMDDDLQHDPASIPALLAAAGHDIVIAQFPRRSHSLWKRFLSGVKGRFDRIILKQPKGVRLGSFRLLNRIVVRGVLDIRTPNPFLPALMLRVSRDMVGVPVPHHPRRDGTESSYTARQMIRLFMTLLINNSSLLLRGVGVTGLVMSILSFTLAGLVIYRKVMHGTPAQGWTSLFAAQMLIGGFLLLAIGIIGEYLIRIIESSENRPAYVVRRRSGKSAVSGAAV